MDDNVNVVEIRIADSNTEQFTVRVMLVEQEREECFIRNLADDEYF